MKLVPLSELVYAEPRPETPATDRVAAFLAEHTTANGYWRGQMEEGALVNVYLIQA